MSDPADEASEYEEVFTQASIDAVLNQNGQKKLAFIGQCHNCGDPLQKPHRFCPDEGCAEDWEYVQKRKRANGLA